jgi:hypothetical protein
MKNIPHYTVAFLLFLPGPLWTPACADEQVNTQAATTPATVPHPHLLWSKDWQTQWTRAMADNHFWWQVVKAKADAEVAGTPAYADDGTFGAIAYQVTGDKKYAVAAYNTVFHQISADTGGLGLVNQFESQFLAFDAPTFAIVYDWIYSGLNSSQKKNLTGELVGIGDLFLRGTEASGKDFWQFMRIPGLNSQYYGDSDQTSYVYWALALLDQALIHRSARAGTFLTAHTKDMYGNSFLVGLDSTGTGGLPPSNPKTLRDAIGGYAEVSAGGAWLEGCEYNRETLRPVMAGWQAMKKATGQEHFPEYAKLIPDIGRFIFHEISPDLKMSYDWGDNEEPRTMTEPYTRELMIWGGVMMMAAGANHGTRIEHQLNQLIDELKDNYSMQHPLSGLGLMNFYPYDPKEDWRQSLPKGYLASGMGQFRYHTGWTDADSYFGAALYTRSGADHELSHFTDFQLYRKGEWAITSPQGYMTYDYEMHNGMGIGGFGAMWKRQPVANEFSKNYAYVAGTTNGTPTNPAFTYNPLPDSFCKEWTRSLFYLPTGDRSADSIVIFDRVDSPNSKEWILHTPVEASVAGGRADWTTPGGHSVQLVTLAPDSPTVTTYADKMSGYYRDSEVKFTLKQIPSAQRDWDQFLNVVSVYDTAAAPKASRIASSAGAAAEGVVLTRTGQPDALVLFGAERANRLLSSGYTFGYVGKKITANLYLLDLSPAKTWTATVDGQPVSLKMNNHGIGSGVGSFTVKGSGTHTITLTAR